MLSRTSKLRAASSSLQRLCRRRLLSDWASTSNAEDADIVIVGGGPAGLALVSALASKTSLKGALKVSLVEAGDLSKISEWTLPPGQFSNRVSSLTNASQAFLKDIGAWDYVDQKRTMPVEDMQVWDGLTDARITFSAAELDLENPENGMSRLTENLNLQRALLQHLNGKPGVQLIDKVRVQSIVNGPNEGDWPLVHLDNGRVIRTRLLVGADGFNSPVRSFAGISSVGWSYDTQAIVATLSHPPRGAFQGPNTTAYQRFLPTGPIAFLPLSPAASSLVWSTRPDIAKAIIAAGPEVLALMVNAAYRLPDVSLRYLYDRILESHQTGTNITEDEIRTEIAWREQSHSIEASSALASSTMTREGNVDMGIPPQDSEMYPPLVNLIPQSTVASFPLRFNHADTYIGEGQGSRTVLVGDAAHTVHPLAGQGLNLGLGDAECLARCIEEAILKGGDIGMYTSLLPYTQERYLENHKLMSVMDKLHKLYTTSFGPLIQARSVGLEVLNEFGSVKAAMMAVAGGKAKEQEAGTFGVHALASGARLMSTVAGIASSVRGGLLTGVLTQARNMVTRK